MKSLELQGKSFIFKLHTTIFTEGEIFWDFWEHKISENLHQVQAIKLHMQEGFGDPSFQKYIVSPLQSFHYILLLTSLVVPIIMKCLFLEIQRSCLTWNRMTIFSLQNRILKFTQNKGIANCAKKSPFLSCWCTINSKQGKIHLGPNQISMLPSAHSTIVQQKGRWHQQRFLRNEGAMQGYCI